MNFSKSTKRIAFEIIVECSVFEGEEYEIPSLKCLPLKQLWPLANSIFKDEKELLSEALSADNDDFDNLTQTILSMDKHSDHMNMVFLKMHLINYISKFMTSLLAEALEEYNVVIKEQSHD